MTAKASVAPFSGNLEVSFSLDDLSIEEQKHLLRMLLDNIGIDGATSATFNEIGELLDNWKEVEA